MPAPTGPVTVSEIVVDAVRVPETPVMVTIDVPAMAVLLAVNVTTLVPVVGLVPNAAVTPLGNPASARVTLPANPFKSVTAMVSVPLLPDATERLAAAGAIVKLGAAVTVNVMGMLLVSVPEVPVIVTEDVPIEAVALAANVITLVVVAGLTEIDVTLMPVGRPLALRVTWPLNGLISVIEMVTLQLPP